MKPTILTFLACLAPLFAVGQGTSMITELPDAVTISAADTLWAFDADAATDVEATFEQVVSPFAADPSSNVAFDPVEWAADLNISASGDWADLTGTPTTLSGYGITDAYTVTAADAAFATAAQGVVADGATQPGDWDTLAKIETVISEDLLTIAEGYAAFDTVGEAAQVQINLNTLSTDVYAELDAVQSDVDANQVTTDAHAADTDNPHAVTASQVGLSNVDNTADADKPVSTATQTELNAKANIADGYTQATTTAIGVVELATPEETFAGSVGRVPNNLFSALLQYQFNFTTWTAVTVGGGTSSATVTANDAKTRGDISASGRVYSTGSIWGGDRPISSGEGSSVNFAKAGAVMLRGYTTGTLSAEGSARFLFGNTSADGSVTLARRGFGIEANNGGYKFLVHDGTTLTSNTITLAVASGGIFIVCIAWDGAGDFTLYNWDGTVWQTRSTTAAGPVGVASTSAVWEAHSIGTASATSDPQMAIYNLTVKLGL